MTEDHWFENSGSGDSMNVSRAPSNANGPFYAQYDAAGQEKKAPKKHRTIGIPALIACLLIVALLSGALGAGIMYAIDSNDRAPKAAITQGGVSIGGANAEENKTDADSGAQNGALPSSGIMTGSTAASANSSVQACADTIVGIDVEITSASAGRGQPATQTGSGSGVLITADGYIVTCNHVVEGASKITVYTDDGTKYEAKLIGSDSRTDLAVLKIEGTAFAHATIGDSGNITLGEPVIVIGNPLGVLLNSVSSGIISGLDRDITLEDGQKMTLLQTDASVNPGNSGGGMFNASGELIGIINAKNLGLEVEGLGFAIPSNQVKTIVTELMDKGYVSGRPFLGVTMQTINFSYGKQGQDSYFPFGSMQNYETRVQIMSVMAGSAAEKGGMQVNDIVLKIDDKEVNSSEQLSSLINEYKAGDVVKITVQRGTQSVELTITLGERTGN